MALLIPGAAHLAAEHAAELPQKDELCGAFWGLLALRAAGIRAMPEGGALDQDAVAQAAGSVLSPAPRTGSLPPGEPPREDYTVTLPEVGDAAHSGTSAAGVARAIEALSSGTLSAVPATGGWSARSLRSLLDGHAELAPPVTLIANVSTGRLWGSRQHASTYLHYLGTGDHRDAAPADWDVGHFVAILGAITSDARALVVTADSYPSLGLQGVHLQPIDRFAAALGRDAPHAGGVLCIVPAGLRSQSEAIVRAAGLETAIWDNGSPDAALRA